MANLITEKQKKAIKTEYIIRASSVSLLIPISLLGLFLLAYIVPYYVSVNKKDLWVAEQFKNVINVENKENVGESMTRIVSQTLDELKAVELYNKNNFIPSVYFNKIIENKNSNIKITKLSYNLVRQGQGQFFVSGISKNRDGLVSFIDDLKSKAGFYSVESPVSDFAKDSDIPFTLNIKTAI
jgi:hypothetical protein